MTRVTRRRSLLLKYASGKRYGLAIDRDRLSVRNELVAEKDRLVLHTVCPFFSLAFL